uniref:FAD-binding PCMH-type domain-containing protein n=1 Tax=Chenopodium quinoa TaxID=63459 RepID=A0A803MUG5_CHEQI
MLSKITAGPYNGGSRVVLRFYLLSFDGKFVNVPQFVCSQNEVSFDRKLGVIVDVSHGMKVMISETINYLALYSASGGKVWVFGVKLIGDGRSLRLTVVRGKGENSNAEEREVSVKAEGRNSTVPNGDFTDHSAPASTDPLAATSGVLDKSLLQATCCIFCNVDEDKTECSVPSSLTFFSSWYVSLMASFKELRGMLCISHVEDNDISSHELEFMVGRLENPFDVLNFVNSLKDEGNIFYKQNQMGSAIAKYSLALKILSFAFVCSGGDKLMFSGITVSLNLNLGACFIKMKDYDRVGQFCSVVLCFDTTNVKAYFRRAIAALELNKHTLAFMDLAQVLKLDPKNCWSPDFVDEALAVTQENEKFRDYVHCRKEDKVTDVSHIQASILCAKETGIEMKVRSGGHDYEGLSYVSIVPFFVVDMFNFRSVDVNIEDETAWVDAGALLGEVYYNIANKSDTHAYPAGVCPTVGAGGHITGGGYGNLMRKYGLTSDNLVDAKVVDVNGRILDRTTMGEDLFWAIRGGGGSSYCVILSYKIKLVKVPKKVTVFRVSRTLDQNLTDIVDQYQHVAPNLDCDAFIRLTLGVTNSTKTGLLTNQATFRCLFLGDTQSLLSLVQENFPLLGLEKSDCLEMSWIGSVLFYYDFAMGTPLSTLLDRHPSSLTSLKRKSDYLKKPIPRYGLEGLWKLMVELQTPQLTFNPYGGQMAEIPADATPFPHRAGNMFKLQYATNWNEEDNDRSKYYIDLTRKLHTYMTPFVSKNPREAFLNYRDIDLGINHQGTRSYIEGKKYGVKYFKDNFDRLVKIKTMVDPDNFFRNEQSIPTLPR